VHHGRRTPPSLAEVTAALPAEPADEAATEPNTAEVDGFEAPDHEPGRIVRIKDHAAEPMSVDQALFEMELVGHDFFLFNDVDSGRPSVVYRRHAFDYGLIRLTQ
jgi:hypothetical protein